MKDSMNRLMVVDDEPSFCTFAKRVASQLGFETECLTDSTRFVEVLRRFRPSVLILDLKMPNRDGAQLLQSVKESHCSARIVVVSGMDHRTLQAAERLARAHGLEVAGILQKPIRLSDLRKTLVEAVNGTNRYTRERLQAAIEAGELVVHYQPKISNTNGCWSVQGAEALVRWQHPTDGLVMPGNFLPMAEESDLIGPLSEYVMEAAVRQVAEWIKRDRELIVAVNMSAKLIRDLDFPDRLVTLLDKYRVPGSNIVLELTESAAMADPSKALDIFLRLRLIDVGLSIDDFGTGFSSLKQLYELPFDELKIDRTFVTELPSNDEARAIVLATVGMAHALNMTVCAEGVETQGALDYLTSIGCDKAQGYFIGRAEPATQFEAFLSSWNRALPNRTASGGQNI